MRDMIEEQNVDEIVRMLGQNMAVGFDEPGHDFADHYDASVDEDEGLIVDSER